MAVSISLAITQNSQSITNNTSSVTVAVTAKWTYGSWNNTGNATGSITIDGTKYNFTGVTFNAGRKTTGSQVIMTKTATVKHNTDGTKTLSCSAVLVSGVSSGTVTCSGSKKLTTIPRATTPTLSSTSVFMESQVTIGLDRANSSFTHDLAYSFAGGCQQDPKGNKRHADHPVHHQKRQHDHRHENGHNDRKGADDCGLYAHYFRRVSCRGNRWAGCPVWRVCTEKVKGQGDYNGGRCKGLNDQRIQHHLPGLDLHRQLLDFRRAGQ